MVNNTHVSQTGDFVNKDLDYEFNRRPIRAKLFESYKKYAWGRKGIIYAINKTHAYNIASLYNSKGVKSAAIDCDTLKDERQDLIESFKNGDLQVLVNVEIFTEGFDCPGVSFIQLARPTCSLALYLQQVGRGLRSEKDKEKTIIIDNVGLYNYFGLPDADRDWLFYFKGREIENSTGHEVSGEHDLGQERDEEIRFEEDNEDMLVIKAGNDEKLPQNSANKENGKEAHLQTEEFSLCDYYLIYGSKEKFSVYPLIKKRGKITQDIGKSPLTYYAEKNPMTFTSDTEDNIQQLAKDMKVQTIVAFSAAMCKISLRKLLNLNNVTNINKCIGLFELLKIIEQRYQSSK